MTSFKRLSIRGKLALLAGVPVLGILILSTLVVVDARQRSATAESLGSIEDLAQLSAEMNELLHQLQNERAHTALAAARRAVRSPELGRQRERTDAASARLDGFLAHRDLDKLPTRLGRDLSRARTALQGLPDLRRKADAGALQLDQVLEFFRTTDESLIRATAALSQLSDDGELLRSISSLVSVMEVKERASREHAVLSFVFAAGEFPPGSYRSLVTLLTEADDYERVLRTHATDAQLALYQAALQGDAVKQAAAMRNSALETTEDRVEGDPGKWFRAQTGKLDALRTVELDFSRRVSEAATSKLAETRRSVRLSTGLAGASMLISLLLAGFIVRGITRSVTHLSAAATEVREKKDYSVRAQKTTLDELGVLTDTFNNMLSGIQERDRELAEHRHNLERLVEERTEALARRNREMRLVLDTVEQGLVTVGRSGKITGERSAAFDRWFGTPPPDSSFATHVAQSEPQLQLLLQLGWDQVVENALPLEVSLAQMPRGMSVGDTRYAFTFTPILDGERIDGALVTISDITAEVAAQRAEAAQREFARVFDRAIHDRTGFLEFVSEVGQLVTRLVGRRHSSAAELLRALHTIKGNCSLFGVESVARVAHELESSVQQSLREPSDLELAHLGDAWNHFTERLSALAELEGQDRVEVTHAEIDELVKATRARTPHERLARSLEELKHEPVALRFDRIQRQIQGLSQRLGKPTPTVLTDAGGVRLPASRWAPFWSAFVHLARNAVDHGLEVPAERERRGKPKAGKITLRARDEAETVVITVGDDGRGIDWEAIRSRAEATGLAHGTHAELVDALFADGVSTASDVSSISGRGVGLGAVREACHALRGSIDVSSTPGHGAAFTFRFPRAAPDP
jgi:two-component system, chemotaxis family, sensor kinase CheA